MSSTSEVPRRADPVSHRRAPDLDPTKRILLARLHELIFAHNAAKMASKSTEESVTNLDAAESSCSELRTGKQQKGKEDRSESPDIFRLFPAPPGSNPPWIPSPGARGPTSDLTDGDSAADDEYVILDRI